MRHSKPGRHAAFTLIEMLVATVLAAVLMTTVLTVMSGVARDRKNLKTIDRPTDAALADLIAFDLRNARTIARGPGDDVALILVGNNAIDRATLGPDGRLVRVVYRIVAGALWRQQEYLDDPARPAPWQEQAAADFRSLTLRPPPDETPAAVPDRVHFDVTTATATAGREVTR